MRVAVGNLKFPGGENSSSGRPPKKAPAALRLTPLCLRDKLTELKSGFSFTIPGPSGKRQVGPRLLSASL
jgi:hypothetical protein